MVGALDANAGFTKEAQPMIDRTVKGMDVTEATNTVYVGLLSPGPTEG